MKPYGLLFMEHSLILLYDVCKVSFFILKFGAGSLRLGRMADIIMEEGDFIEHVEWN